MENFQKELHSKYRQLILLALSGVSEKILTSKELDDYFRNMALQIWKTGTVSQAVCREMIEAVYTDEKKTFTRNEIENILKEGTLSIEVPHFFSRIIEDDLNNCKNNSRKFIAITEQILLLFSMIDAKIERVERTIINKCVQDLTFECDLKGIEDMKESIPSANKGAKRYSAVKDEIRADRDAEPKADDPETPKPLKTLDDLYKLIGLNGAKEEVKNAIDLVNFQRNREKMGLPSIDSSRHLVFTGNPGTGKTTVARILADIFKANGVLSTGQMIEVAREDLVAAYVGQTAIKTKEALEKALGGILFIDEAYTLIEGGSNDFGQEAINTLLKYMEDHRDELIVIAAGYEDEMKSFIESNPGLKSRFTTYIHFEDYSIDELYQIFKLMCNSVELKYDESLEPKIKEQFKKKKEESGKFFGNGREVRNYLREIFQRIARRTGSGATREELSTAIYEDFNFEG